MRWNLPNLLTWLRMLAIPLLVAVYLVPVDGLTMPTRNLLGTSLFVAAAILLVMANAFPIVTLQLQGDETDATLLRAARVMFDEERPDVALLVLVTGVLAPAIQIAAALYVLVALRMRRLPRGFATAFRLFRQSAPWAMVEVFALGVLVSMVKLAHVATIVPGIALWSFGVLMAVLAAAVNAIDTREIWARAEALA